MILVCGTSMPGGIKSVIDAHAADGVYSPGGWRVLETHVEGSRLARLSAFGRSVLVFIRLIATRRASLVHLHAAMKGSFWRKALLATLAKKCHIPVILHLHGSGFASFVDGVPLGQRRLIARVLTRVDRVVVLSESWRSYVRGVAPKARVVVIPNYVHLGTAERARSVSLGVRVLFLGYVGDRKGVFDLIEALRLGGPRLQFMSLHIAGNGEIDRARSAARSAGLTDRVTVLGWIGPDARARELRDADIVALPSYNEGLPMAVLEAMAQGLPVITTPVGGIPELIQHRENGWLVQPGDVKALTEALHELSDDELRCKLGAAGRARIESTYAAARVIPQWRALYDELGVR